jgi:hypothetical protein
MIDIPIKVRSRFGFQVGQSTLTDQKYTLFPPSYQNYDQNQQKLGTFLENFKSQSFQKVSLIKVGLQIKYSLQN